MPIPADITLEKIQSRLTGRVIGRRLRVVAEIGSTNDAAMAAGHAGEPEGLAILADRQESGRGRLGRTWASVSGLGIYTSILLRPPVPPLQAPLLTLMAGLATAEAIEAVGQVTPALKWPNDVLCGGRKVAGILTEMATMGQQIGHVVVGRRDQRRSPRGGFSRGDGSDGDLDRDSGRPPRGSGRGGRCALQCDGSVV